MDALPLIFTSTSAMAVSEKVDWTFFEMVLTHSVPPRALWDVACLPREYLGVRNDDGALTVPPKGYKKPSYVFDVAPWDKSHEERWASEQGARG